MEKEREKATERVILPLSPHRTHTMTPKPTNPLSLPITLPSFERGEGERPPFPFPFHPTARRRALSARVSPIFF